MDALTADFYATAMGMAVAPCPGAKDACGSGEDQPGVAWTCDASLLLATVNGGSNEGS